MNKINTTKDPSELLKFTNGQQDLIKPEILKELQIAKLIDINKSTSNIATILEQFKTECKPEKDEEEKKDDNGNTDDGLGDDEHRDSITEEETKTIPFDITPAIAAAVAASMPTEKNSTIASAVATAVAAVASSQEPQKKEETKTPTPPPPQKIEEKIKNEIKKTIEIITSVPESTGTEPTVFSSDSITYVTPQGVVYIYNKKSKKIYEYEGSIETKRLREVRLVDNSIIEIKQGDNWEKLSYGNFKKLYPVINDDEEEKSEQFFFKMRTASVKVLKDIQSIRK